MKELLGPDLFTDSIRGCIDILSVQIINNYDLIVIKGAYCDAGQ